QQVRVMLNSLNLTKSKRTVKQKKSPLQETGGNTNSIASPVQSVPPIVDEPFVPRSKQLRRRKPHEEIEAERNKRFLTSLQQKEKDKKKPLIPPSTPVSPLGAAPSSRNKPVV